MLGMGEWMNGWIDGWMVFVYDTMLDSRCCKCNKRE